MKILLAIILLAFNQQGNLDDSKTKMEIEQSEITVWFILVDGEIVEVIESAKNVDVNLTEKYISYYTDFIFNDSFEEQNKILKKIRK